MFPMVAGGMVGGAIAHGLLYTGAKAFAAADAAAAYTSEIKADLTGINMSVKVAAPAPAPVNNVQITPALVEVNAPTININGASLVAVKTDAAVTVEALTVEMEGETSVDISGAAVSIGSDGATLTTAPDTMQMKSADIELSTTNMLALISASDLVLDGMGIQLTAENKVEVTAVQVNVDAPTIAISGEVIRLG
jgi:type VI secretion system secreted protein VgrG